MNLDSETGITKIYAADDLGSSPAKVNRYTGEMYISRRLWNDMPPEHRLFILLHEAGHVTWNTRNELEADRFAFNAYAKLGYPLSKAVTSLSRVLHFENPQHFDRLAQQIRRAFVFDKRVNKQPLDLNKMKDVLQTAYKQAYTGGDQYDNFFLTKLLVPKKARANIKAKIEAKKAVSETRKAETEKKTAEARSSTAKANSEAAKYTSPANNPQQSAGPDQGTGTAGTKKIPWLLIGGAALVVVIIIVVLVKKKKK